MEKKIKYKRRDQFSEAARSTGESIFLNKMIKSYQSFKIYQWKCQLAFTKLLKTSRYAPQRMNSNARNEAIRKRFIFLWLEILAIIILGRRS